MTLDYGKVAPTEVNPNSEKEIQMSTKERDCEASALQAEGLTWVEVAERLGLANGGVARRCAMRHRERYPDGFEPTEVKQPSYLKEWGKLLGKAIAEDLGETKEPPHETVKRISKTEITINGRTVVPKTEISIRGEAGRFTFHYSLRDDEVCVWGGQPQYEKWRTFKIDRVRTVHRKPKLRKNAEGTDETEEES
jgi:hypothetical protein